MLENPSDPPPPIKRYAHPNQRNRSLNRRKSADRSERTTNIISSDGDKNSGIDNYGTGSPTFGYENRPRLIALKGCYTSEASQLLHERWKEVLRCYSDPTVDLSERPVMYAGSGASAWGSFRLPHQLMSAPQLNFLAQLQHAINNSSATSIN